MKFYKEAVNLLRKQRGEMEVVVLSDDMEWCRKNIQIPGAHFIGRYISFYCLPSQLGTK